MTAKKVWAMSDNENITAEYNDITHPEHYCSGDIECIDAMISALGLDAVRDYCRGNAFKYIWRASRKNGDKDMEKARWYIDKYVELGRIVER